MVDTNDKLNTPVGDTKPEEGEKVLVDKITLENLLSRVATLEEGNNTVRRIMRIKNHTAKVRYFDEEMTKMVVGYGKSWEKVDLGGRRYLVIEVYTVDKDGKKEKHEVEYVRFMEEGKYVEAEILDIKKEEEIVEYGKVFKTKVDYDNYRSEQTDQEVPLQVTSLKCTYKLRLPDGSEVEVPEKGLN